MRILVVEDDADLRRQLADVLGQSGYAVDLAADGEDGHFLGDTEPYDAVILDLGLPKMDGVSVLKKWRADGKSFPVLILTARDSWSEKVAGFDAGADDYLTKPFITEELLARLRALLRRAAGHSAATIEAGKLMVDPRAARAMINGEPVNEPPAQGEIVWRDDLGVTCRRWNWRQCTRTRLTPSTKNALFIFDGLAPSGATQLREAAEDLAGRFDEASFASRILGLHMDRP